MADSSVNTVFESLRETFAEQEVVRDNLRDRREAADTPIRAAQHALVALHTAEDLPAVCKTVREAVSKCGPCLAAIEAALPEEAGAFYRYSDLWTTHRQTVAMICVLVEFISNDGLPEVDDIVRMAGGEFKLPLEDFLIGVCNAVSELVRLSMNRVIKMDYRTPARCCLFASFVFDSFKELNFRNDFLRKRYDGVKYDVKRLEEIVYDLSIRGLLAANGTDDANADRVAGDQMAAEAAEPEAGKAAAAIDVAGKAAEPKTGEEAARMDVAE